MFGRRRKDVGVAVVVEEPELEAGLGWADDSATEDGRAWAVARDQGEPSRRVVARLHDIRTIPPRVRAARAALSPYAATARERLVPAVAEARGRVVPAVAGARGRVVPAVAGARETLVDTVAPAVAGAVNTAVAAAREGKPGRAEARRRGAAALAALRGELPPARRRWPVVLISLLAGAAAGATAGIAVRRAAGPSEPSYIPATPTPSPQGQPYPGTTAASSVDISDEPVGTPSDLGWPEQSAEPFASSDQDAVIAMEEIDLTLADDSSETHKPTA